MLSHYDLTAERLDGVLISTPKSSMTLSVVNKLPYVNATFGGFTYESNQWALGWIKYRHGQHWPHSRARATDMWTN
eukprot:3841186-Pyramimonas_sp.AAC.1